MIKFKIYNTHWTMDFKKPLEVSEEYKKDMLYIDQDINYYLAGYCDNNLHKIIINTSQCEESIKLTIIHELTHAFLNSIGHYGKENLTVEELCEFNSCHYIEFNKAYSYILDKLNKEN